MSKAVARKLDKWIADADDAEELADELSVWFDDDPDDDELEEMALAIAERLIGKADTDSDGGEDGYE